MNLIFLVAAAASMQMTEPAPSLQQQPSQPQLPFETGQLVFTIRAWAGGATRCDTVGRGAAFEAVAPSFCDSASFSSQDGQTDGDPIVEVATVITLTRNGDVPASLPDIRGQTSVDAEMEVEVSADGSVSACRLLRGDRSDQAAPELQPETYCGDMLRLPPFQAEDGGPSRRGRVRVTVISSSPGPPSRD